MAVPIGGGNPERGHGGTEPGRGSGTRGKRGYDQRQGTPKRQSGVERGGKQGNLAPVPRNPSPPSQPSHPSWPSRPDASDPSASRPKVDRPVRTLGDTMVKTGHARPEIYDLDTHEGVAILPTSKRPSLIQEAVQAHSADTSVPAPEPNVPPAPPQPPAFTPIPYTFPRPLAESHPLREPQPDSTGGGYDPFSLSAYTLVDGDTITPFEERLRERGVRLMFPTIPAVVEPSSPRGDIYTPYAPNPLIVRHPLAEMRTSSQQPRQAELLAPTPATTPAPEIPSPAAAPEPTPPPAPNKAPVTRPLSAPPTRQLSPHELMPWGNKTRELPATPAADARSSSSGHLPKVRIKEPNLASLVPSAVPAIPSSVQPADSTQRLSTAQLLGRDSSANLHPQPPVPEPPFDWRESSLAGLPALPGGISIRKDTPSTVHSTQPLPDLDSHPSAQIAAIHNPLRSGEHSRPIPKVQATPQQPEKRLHAPAEGPKTQTSVLSRLKSMLPGTDEFRIRRTLAGLDPHQRAFVEHFIHKPRIGTQQPDKSPTADTGRQEMTEAAPQYSVKERATAGMLARLQYIQELQPDSRNPMRFLGFINGKMELEVEVDAATGDVRVSSPVDPSIVDVLFSTDSKWPILSALRRGDQPTYDPSIRPSHREQQLHRALAVQVANLAADSFTASLKKPHHDELHQDALRSMFLTPMRALERRFPISIDANPATTVRAEGSAIRVETVQTDRAQQKPIQFSAAIQYDPTTQQLHVESFTGTPDDNELSFTFSPARRVIEGGHINPAIQALYPNLPAALWDRASRLLSALENMAVIPQSQGPSPFAHINDIIAGLQQIIISYTPAGESRYAVVHGHPAPQPSRRPVGSYRQPAMARA